jgi:hypothetical protein
MPCAQLTNILKGCDNNLGGIKRFYITAKDNVTATTIATGGEIATITLASNTAFVEYEFTKNSSNYVEDGNFSLENGSTFYTVTTTLNIPRREQAKRNSIMLIAAGHQDLAIIIQDQNGLYWYQGLINGANLTAQGEGSGTAKADGSKYSLTFLSEEPEMMREVDPAIIAGLL